MRSKLKMELDRDGQIRIGEWSVEGYLNKLKEARSNLTSIGLEELNPDIYSALDAFVKFYSTFQRCTDTIRTIVHTPQGYNDGRDGLGDIIMHFSLIPDYHEDNRVSRD